MPRVAIKKKDYKMADLSAYIISKMRVKGLLQRDMANELNISQPGFCSKLRECSFTYEQMLIVFKVLGSTDDEILKYMKM